MKPTNPRQRWRSCGLRVLETTTGEGWRTTRRLVLHSSANEKRPWCKELCKFRQNFSLQEHCFTSAVLSIALDVCKRHISPWSRSMNGHSLHHFRGYYPMPSRSRADVGPVLPLSRVQISRDTLERQIVLKWSDCSQEGQHHGL